jgi:hypothetical protein
MFSAFATTHQFLWMERSQRRQLTIFFPKSAFTGIEGGGIAVEGVESHSIKKFAATHVTSFGMHKR